MLHPVVYTTAQCNDNMQRWLRACILAKQYCYCQTWSHWSVVYISQSLFRLHLVIYNHTWSPSVSHNLRTRMVYPVQEKCPCSIYPLAAVLNYTRVVKMFQVSYLDSCNMIPVHATNCPIKFVPWYAQFHSKNKFSNYTQSQFIDSHMPSVIQVSNKIPTMGIYLISNEFIITIPQAV